MYYICMCPDRSNPHQSQSNLLPLPCAILIYLSKFVKKELYEFYLWPAHAAHGRLPRPARPARPLVCGPQVLAYHVTDYFRQIYTRKII